MRGVNWLLASCSTTIVIEKTRPVTEIMALAMVLSRLRAPSGPPSKTNGTCSASAESSAGRTRPRTKAETTMAVGTAQNGCQRRVHVRVPRKVGDVGQRAGT